MGRIVGILALALPLFVTPLFAETAHRKSTGRSEAAPFVKPAPLNFQSPTHVELTKLLARREAFWTTSPEGAAELIIEELANAESFHCGNEQSLDGNRVSKPTNLFHTLLQDLRAHPAHLVHYLEVAEARAGTFLQEMKKSALLADLIEVPLRFPFTKAATQALWQLLSHAMDRSDADTAYAIAQHLRQWYWDRELPSPLRDMVLLMANSPHPANAPATIKENPAFTKLLRHYNKQYERLPHRWSSWIHSSSQFFMDPERAAPARLTPGLSPVWDAVRNPFPEERWLAKLLRLGISQLPSDLVCTALNLDEELRKPNENLYALAKVLAVEGGKATRLPVAKIFLERLPVEAAPDFVKAFFLPEVDDPHAALVLSRLKEKSHWLMFLHANGFARHLPTFMDSLESPGWTKEDVIELGSALTTNTISPAQLADHWPQLIPFMAGHDLSRKDMESILKVGGPEAFRQWRTHLADAPPSHNPLLIEAVFSLPEAPAGWLPWLKAQHQSRQLTGSESVLLAKLDPKNKKHYLGPVREALTHDPFPQTLFEQFLETYCDEAGSSWDTGFLREIIDREEKLDEAVHANAADFNSFLPYLVRMKLAGAALTCFVRQGKSAEAERFVAELLARKERYSSYLAVTAFYQNNEKVDKIDVEALIRHLPEQMGPTTVLRELFTRKQNFPNWDAKEVAAWIRAVLYKESSTLGLEARHEIAQLLLPSGLTDEDTSELLRGHQRENSQVLGLLAKHSPGAAPLLAFFDNVEFSQDSDSGIGAAAITAGFAPEKVLPQMKGRGLRLAIMAMGDRVDEGAAHVPRIDAGWEMRAALKSLAEKHPAAVDRLALKLAQTNREKVPFVDLALSQFPSLSKEVQETLLRELEAAPNGLYPFKLAAASLGPLENAGRVIALFEKYRKALGNNGAFEIHQLWGRALGKLLSRLRKSDRPYRWTSALDPSSIPDLYFAWAMAAQDPETAKELIANKTLSWEPLTDSDLMVLQTTTALRFGDPTARKIAARNRLSIPVAIYSRDTIYDLLSADPVQGTAILSYVGRKTPVFAQNYLNDYFASDSPEFEALTPQQRRGIAQALLPAAKGYDGFPIAQQLIQHFDPTVWEE